MPAPPQPLVEALADRYQIERELGRGGMATVYLAQDLRHDRPLALKVLDPELAHAVGPERFLREIRVTARLHHPHILPIHDSGAAGGLLWYTMPFVDAARMLNEPPSLEGYSFEPRPSDVLWYLERGRVAERLGDRNRALEAYRYVSAIWRRPNSELEAYATEARAGLARLTTESRPP